MKTKFDNRQLAHVWAQQTQDAGDGSNFYFRGPSIYSYGSHFEIARFITRKGARAVLFTTRTYSVTTARHLGFARGALHGLSVPVFNVPDIDAAARGSDATRDYYKGAVDALMLRAARARGSATPVRCWNEAIALAEEANDYAAFFGRRWRIKAPQLAPEVLATYRERVARQARRDKAKQAKREAERAALHAESLRAWRAGESDSLNWPGPTALRIAHDRIETSRGAHVPLEVAPLVWRLVTKHRDTGLGWAAGLGDRPRLGDFTLDAISADGDITAGCHSIPYAELRGIAVQLGYIREGQP